ncbi:hypothetical protein A3768_4862 (plasmid) [Ralstonia solanacearum]|nr:hypothetical protein A3768_4862 [Ralstonia solanacearum]
MAPHDIQIQQHAFQCTGRPAATMPQADSGMTANTGPVLFSMRNGARRAAAPGHRATLDAVPFIAWPAAMHRSMSVWSAAQR